MEDFFWFMQIKMQYVIVNICIKSFLKWEVSWHLNYIYSDLISNKYLELFVFSCQLLALINQANHFLRLNLFSNFLQLAILWMTCIILCFYYFRLSTHIPKIPETLADKNKANEIKSMKGICFPPLKTNSDL